MSMTTRLFERAISLSKNGRSEAARPALRTVLIGEPRNLAAWFWYLDTLRTRQECAEALELLIRIDPQHRAAYAALLARRSARVALPAPARPATPHRWLNAASLVLALLLLVVGLLGYLAVNRSAALSTDLEIASKRFAVLDSMYASLAAEHQSAQAENQRLQQAYAASQAARLTLAADNVALRAQLADLQNQVAALHGQVAGLQQENGALRSQVAGLEEQNGALIQQVKDLQTANLWLNDQLAQSIRAPYIRVHERTFEAAFYGPNGAVQTWEFPFEALEAAVRDGAIARDWANTPFAPPLRLKNPATGETYQVTDLQPFINPEPFRPQMAALRGQASEEAAFITSVWKIVRQLTVYTSEIGETPRTPLETLLAGGGDCEDSAILFASLIRAAPVNWAVRLVYMDGRHPLSPATVDHVIVEINTGTRRYLVETTGDVMLPYGDEVIGWYFEVR